MFGLVTNTNRLDLGIDLGVDKDSGLFFLWGFFLLSFQSNQVQSDYYSRF